MGVHLIGLVACMAVLPARPVPPPSGDGVTIQSMLVVGTVVKFESLALRKPYAKDRVPYAAVPHQLSGGDFCVEVVQGGTRAVVFMSLGGDKAMKEQAAKLVGRRVVVECRGEYKLVAVKESRKDNLVWVEEPVAYATVVLTVVRITPSE